MDPEARPLSEVLNGKPFGFAPLELEFVGGPNDGRTEDVPCWFLEAKIGGHKYHLALARSSDPSVPFKYVLVSHSLVKKP